MQATAGVDLGSLATSNHQNNAIGVLGVDSRLGFLLSPGDGTGQQSSLTKAMEERISERLTDCPTPMSVARPTSP